MQLEPIWTPTKISGRIYICHLCKGFSDVRYCPRCDHWFCKECRGKYFSRGLEALKQMVKGREAGCCGPVDKE